MQTEHARKSLTGQREKYPRRSSGFLTEAVLVRVLRLSQRGVFIDYKIYLYVFLRWSVMNTKKQKLFWSVGFF